MVVELKRWSEVDWATGLEVSAGGRPARTGQTSAHPAQQACGYVCHLEH
ncbi:hypothetical protein [Actinosynnema pretiosum]|nr:hypothetical protein [Actinosynnema pretiosum]